MNALEQALLADGVDGVVHNGETRTLSVVRGGWAVDMDATTDLVFALQLQRGEFEDGMELRFLGQVNDEPPAKILMYRAVEDGFTISTIGTNTELEPEVVLGRGRSLSTAMALAFNELW